METAVDCKGPVDAWAAAGLPAGIMPAGIMAMLPGGVMTRPTCPVDILVDIQWLPLVMMMFIVTIFAGD